MIIFEVFVIFVTTNNVIGLQIICVSELIIGVNE